MGSLVEVIAKALVTKPDEVLPPSLQLQQTAQNIIIGFA